MDREEAPATCKSCGVAWVDHLGIQPTCKENLELKAEVKRLKKAPKWHKFTPGLPGNRQKLPAPKKYVLVNVSSENGKNPDCVTLGYLKFHAGVKTEPYFETPGNGTNLKASDHRVTAWCDCLPESFEPYPKDFS